MPTFQEITDKISRLITPNPSTDITRTVEKLILNYRALLIRRDLEKSRRYHDKLVQTIPQLALIEKETIGTTSFRTFSTEVIPSIVRLKTGYAIRFIGVSSRLTAFNYVDPAALRIVTYSRYTHKDNLYTILDGKIYILLSDHSINAADTDVNYPGFVRLEAIFENPTELFDFNDNPFVRVYDIESQFPITEDLEQQITQSILTTEARLLNPQRINEVNTDPQ